MYEFQVESSVEAYNVQIGETDLDLTGYAFVLADDYFSTIFSSENLFFVQATEENKTLAAVESICIAMREAGVRRDSLVAAFGGGVVQDLGTLAFALYMRGIDWHYYPTTLTGMLDSCLGGKSSINVSGQKNLIGNIYPPAKVIVIPGLASTLSLEHEISGYAEAAKICFARGTSTFEDFLLYASVSQLADSTNLIDLIFTSLSSKKWFIEIDEFDRKERQLLNFGHTFGHALEVASNFAIPHGVAVAIGMLAAIEHKNSKKGVETERLARYVTSLLKPLGEKLFPVFEKLDWSLFDDAILSDKKNTSDALCHILPMEKGELARIFVPFEDGALAEASIAMRAGFQRLKRSNE